jgi:hypothetical protein
LQISSLLAAAGDILSRRKILDDNVETTSGYVSIGTMHSLAA